MGITVGGGPLGGNHRAAGDVSQWTFDSVFGTPYEEKAKGVFALFADSDEEDSGTEWMTMENPKGERKALNFTEFFREALDEYERAFDALEGRREKVYRKMSYTCMRGANVGRKSGDEIVDELHEQFEDLDSKGFRRSKQQRLICNVFIRACLRHLYGDELRTDLLRIYRKYNITYIHNMVMCALARRFGKTTVTSIYTACYLNCVPNAKVVIYSISRRTSTMLAAKILHFLSLLNGEGWSPDRHNQEEIKFVNNAGTEVSINSYPAAERISIIFHVFIFRAW